MSNDYSELIARLRELADKFSEGWHDGIRIDASDVMDLSKSADALTAQARELEALRAEKSAMWDALVHACGDDEGMAVSYIQPGQSGKAVTP